MKDVLKPWLEAGYSAFAEQGPEGIKVERLSKKVGKNKSSFYHHFAEIDIFIAHLIDWHIQRAFTMIKKESESESMHELINVLVDHKEDLLFNRQLRIHRHRTEFQGCIAKIDDFTFRSIGPLWAHSLGLHDNTYLAGLVLKLSLDNFYLQVTPENMNAEWLQNYFLELKGLIQEFQKTGKYSELDGSV